MPWRTARPLRGHTRPAWPGGISMRNPVATAARSPGASVSASFAYRSAPAAPTDEYSGSSVPCACTSMSGTLPGGPDGTGPKPAGYHGQEMAARANLFGMDRPALECLAAELGEPAYRAGQIYSWLYRRR